MRAIRNEDGFIKPVLCIAALAITLYAGFQFAMPYYRYTAFKSDVKQIARLELKDVEKTKTAIYESAMDLKIQIEKDDIFVAGKERTIQVKTSWSEQVDILGLYQRTLHFSVNIEE